MIVSLENLYDFSLEKGNPFRRRRFKEKLSETSKTIKLVEGKNSSALEKIIDSYQVANIANSSIKLSSRDESSISAHAFLSDFNQKVIWSYKNNSKHGFDSSSFSKAIREENNLPGKNSPEIQNNERLSSNGLADLSSCLCPSCSQLNILSQDSEVLTALAPQEAPRYIDLSENIDVNETFFLHSNPAANHTIYLDFNGFSIDNTPWENGGPMSLAPFYADLDSSKARLEIQNIWNRVSADFAPFNINVTTEEPDIEDLRNRGVGDFRWGIRVALTSNQNLDNLDSFGNPRQIANAGGGGTAFFKSFNWADDDVALVFNQGEYAASETVSHEVGHALNLRHDGTNTRTNSPTYYEGHGTGEVSWGSIMGAPFIGDQEIVTTWSKGEYNDANNTEDDLLIITSQNGFGYRIDDHGNNFNSASGLLFSEVDSLNVNKLNILTPGLIETTNDLDYFTFETSGGVLNLDISNAATAYIAENSNSYERRYLNPKGPNLDISVKLYNSDRKIVATSSKKSFLSASFNNIQLNRGTYFLKVQGVGAGTPFDINPTGYTAYASLGEYLINGSILTDNPLNTLESSKSYTLKRGEKNLELIGSQSINGSGNILNNKITGNNAKNIINGKGGGDKMIGKKGDDIYYVNNKNDKVIEVANQGEDTVRSSVTETLSNNVEDLILTGSKAINGNGNNLNNKITGNNNKNNLKGLNGKDEIYGRGGKDVLTGGAKADQFIYKSINDSGTTGATRDVITDFSGIDKINLAKVDADQGTGGNQELVFIGSDSFSGAGQVRFNNGLLSVNTDDDLTADMQIKLLGVTTFDETSLIL